MRACGCKGHAGIVENAAPAGGGCPKQHTVAENVQSEQQVDPFVRTSRVVSELLNQTSIVSGIAGRYASALFDLAREGSALDDVAGDLEAIDAMIAGSADLARFARSPVIAREDQGRAIDAVLEAAGIGDLARRFVGLVARNRRLFALRGMMAAYRTLLADHRGQTTARVTSARLLTAEQIARIESRLAGIVDQEISLTTDVDESLLGGLVVRIGSRMIDSSFKTKLQGMRTAMKEAG